LTLHKLLEVCIRDAEFFFLPRLFLGGWRDPRRFPGVEPHKAGRLKGVGKEMGKINKRAKEGKTKV
jgi:hypothetical protein